MSRVRSSSFGSLAILLAVSTAHAQKAPQLAPTPPAPAPTAHAAAAPSSAEMETKLSSMLAGIPGGLTSDTAAHRAEATAPSVRDRQHQLESNEARVEAVKAGYYPRLVGTARATYLSPLTPPSFGTILVSTNQAPGPVQPGEQLIREALAFPIIQENYQFKASLSVPFSDYVFTVSSAIAAATKSRHAAELNEQAERLSVAVGARQTYFEWVRAKAQLVVAEQTVSEYIARRDDAKRSFDIGLSSKADFLQADAVVQQGQLALVRAKNAVMSAEEQLRTMLHDPPGTAYAIGEDVRRPPPPFADYDDLAKLEHEAFDQRLELRALDETAFALREAAYAQRMANLPRLDGSANATMANPNPRIFPQVREFDGTWDVNLTLSWAPTDIFANNAKARDTEAQAASNEEKKLALLDGLRNEVMQAWLLAADAKAATEASLKSLVASEESYRVRGDLYRAGKATLVEVTDAQTGLTRARIEVINSHINEHVAYLRLHHAVGRDVKEHDLALASTAGEAKSGAR